MTRIKFNPQDLVAGNIDTEKFAKNILSGKNVKSAVAEVKNIIHTIDIDMSKLLTAKIPALKPFPRLIGSMRPNWTEMTDLADKYYSDYGSGRLEDNPLGVELCSPYFKQVRGNF